MVHYPPPPDYPLLRTHVVKGTGRVVQAPHTGEIPPTAFKVKQWRPVVCACISEQRILNCTGPGTTVSTSNPI